MRAASYPAGGYLTIVLAALAVSHHIETQIGWSIKKFVRTARGYRTVQIKAGRQILTGADPLPPCPLPSPDFQSAILASEVYLAPILDNP